jgi:hypothetical protein
MLKKLGLPNTSVGRNADSVQPAYGQRAVRIGVTVVARITTRIGSLSLRVQLPLLLFVSATGLCLSKVSQA